MMSAPNLEEELVPELGDLITLISTVFGRLTGTIIYRDADIIRVQSFSDADRAQNIPMAEDGDFREEAGIIRLIIHKKREDPHFSLQLGANVGEYVNCYGLGGEPLEGGRVAEVIATDEEDSIVLDNGTKLNFAFIGPPEPIQVIFVTATADEGEDVPPAAEPVAVEPGTEALPDYYNLSFMDGLLPAAMVEEVPTAERTYSENVQREDMYMDLLKSYSEAKQKNPKIQKSLARETELLLALKSVAGIVGPDGRMKPYIKPSKTLKDILSNNGASLAAVIPVISAKRVVYVDQETEAELDSEISKQVEIRLWIESELKSWQAEQSYTAGQDAGVGAKQAVLMYKYLYNVLFTEGSVLAPNDEEDVDIAVDQDVLRTVEPPSKLYGFSKLVIEKDTKISQKNIGKIKTRQLRALSSHKTASGSVISPSDPGKISSYILMMANLGYKFRPVKFSGFLAEDIRASNVTKQLEPFETLTNSAAYYKGEAGLKVISNSLEADETSTVDVAEWVRQNLHGSIHASDLLSASSVGVNRVLDSIGLRSYEWTPELSEVIWSAVKKSQAEFTRVYQVFLESVEAYLKSETPYKIGSGISDASTIYAKAATIKEIGAELSNMALYDPTNADWDLAKAQYLLSKAEGCMAQLMYFATSEDPHPLLERAIHVYNNEMNRKALHSAQIYDSLAKFHAEPTINTCPHCKDLDAIRSVMMYDEAKFIKLLGEFLNRYQGDRKGSWVQCKVCSTNLLCIHEVMKFYEKTHPGRAPALSKEILLDFGGAAFNGRYVCKNCGIPIAEFEYDNHLEYDDEGRPLAGRAPVEEGKKGAEDELSQILDMAMNKKKVTFDDEIKTQIYELVSIMTVNAGFMFNEETITDLVNRVYVYETTKLPKEADYEEMRARAKKPMPVYESFKANIEIGLIAALLLCEIHTVDPLPELIYPFGGCDFSRGGYPIETDDETILGAFEYIVCVIANMNRDQRPWNITEWWGESSPEDRKKRVRAWVKKMLKEPDIVILLKTARDSYATHKKASATQASAADKIPANFRPTALLKSPAFDSVNIALPGRIVESAATMPIGEAEVLIKEKAFQMAISGILNAHQAANDSGIINPASIRSESNCCFLPISEIRKGTISAFLPAEGEQEIMGLGIAETILHKRDPTSQSNGAHLWVRWTPPQPLASDPVPPDTSYFKLFMRTCFKGPRAGDIHEFGRRLNGAAVVYQCRHCNFQAPRDPLIIMSDLSDEDLSNANPKRKGDPSTKIRDEAAAALTASGVTIDASTFDELLNIVCRKQRVDPYVLPRQADSALIFAAIDRMVTSECPLLPARMTDWTALKTIVDGLFSLGSDIEEDRRIIVWADFSTRYDALKARVIELIDAREGPKMAAKGKVGAEIIDTIERMTDDPLFKGPSEINKNWIVGLERLGTSFSQMVFGSGEWFGFPFDVKKLRKIQHSLFGGLKWFGKSIKEKHTSKFENMIKSLLGSTNTATTVLNREELKTDSANVLKPLAAWLGKLNSFWISNIKSLHMYGVSNVELSNILRWIVFSSMEALLVTSSPLYTAVGSESNKAKIKTVVLAWAKESLLESKKQFDLFGMSDAEVEAAILDLREKEKISIIKELDDIKDPDEKAAEMMQMRLGIGRWAVGGKKGGEFDAEYWNFLQGQRDRIGVIDTYGTGAVKENAMGYDFAEEAQADRAYQTYAGQDEDEGGGRGEE